VEDEKSFQAGLETLWVEKGKCGGGDGEEKRSRAVNGSDTVGFIQKRIPIRPNNHLAGNF